MYNFVRQHLVYDMIVDILGFGRSPSRIGFHARGRLATLNDRDYDPSSAPGGRHPPRPWRNTPGRLAPLRTRTAEQEGYPV